MGDIVDELVFVEQYEILDFAGDLGGRRLPTLPTCNCWAYSMDAGEMPTTAF